MNLHSLLQAQIVAASLLSLAPLLVAGFAPAWTMAIGRGMPRAAQLATPALLCLPYVLVATSFGVFRWKWFVLYALLPVAMVILLDRARAADSRSRGNWRDYLVLVVLGLAVDLRWFEPAWPRGYSVFGKILLLDAGIFGFLVVRQLDGAGFDLRLKLRDLRVGLREFGFYAAIAIPLGLWLGFLHFHAIWPRPWNAAGGFVFTFFLIAIPEELFFRGWIENLLERRIGRTGALALTAILFGLSHWNKRTTSFNWPYVSMAAIAGVFYGRAWRDQRRVAASSITHATVDTLWSLWLR